MIKIATHNHGTEEGPGLACREILTYNHGLMGTCLLEESSRIPDIPEIRSAWVADQARNGHLAHTANFDKRLEIERARWTIAILKQAIYASPDAIDQTIAELKEVLKDDA